MRVLGVLLLLVLAGCGFQLRGTADVPFDTVYVAGATSGIALSLKRNIQAGTNARVVDSAKEADAILRLSNEDREREILSLTGSGRVREFRLVYRVDMELNDAKGASYLPRSTIEITRDVSFNDAQVLAKEAEEELLFRDMQADMVQQVMRRLAAAKKPVARVQ